MQRIRQPAESQTSKRRRYQRHPVGLRLAAVERMKLGANVSALAEELGVDRTLLYLWKKRGAPKREADSESEADFDQREQQIRELQARLQNWRGIWDARFGGAFFQTVPCANRGVTPEARRHWRDSVYAEIRGAAPAQGGLSIQRLCEMAQVSRPVFYQQLGSAGAGCGRDALRDAVQKAALAHRAMATGALTAWLERAVFVVGVKRVRRIMKQDNLLRSGGGSSW